MKIMHPTAIGMAVLACTYGGALAGIRLRGVLPEDHLGSSTRETVHLGIGLIAMMTALVLGLVTASAKSSFDTLDAEIKQAAADVISLDRALARYGPETGDIRGQLKRTLAHRVDMTWPRGRSPNAQLEPSTGAPEQVSVYVRKLAPQTEEQRWLQARALELAESLLRARWLIFAGIGTSVPVPFLAILVFWLTITFFSFGLFAPGNTTVLSVLFVCALSVASAVFLVLEMDGPFEGLITVSPDPLEYALSHMGQ